MIIAFCGHSNYQATQNHRDFVLNFLKEYIDDPQVEFFLGEYGSFDSFAYSCAKEFKKLNPSAKLVFVTPYVPCDSHKRIALAANRFDLVLYPPLESVPLKYAISHRNRWIVEHADLVIAYVTRKYGGAYTMYRYAKRKQVKIYNLAEADIK